jgi:dTDP-4-dehydrorhamnose 3,5-epimerase
LKVLTTAINGILVIEPNLYRDDRGFFTETWQQDRYADIGIDRVFVQDNLSSSVKQTLRGLHFQIQHPQAKLVQAIRGELYDVALDLRPDSPTFGKWEGFLLSEENMRQVYIPEGFAHGFCVLSDTALFSYKCSDFYTPGDEGGVLWSDPDLAIDWPVKTPILSEKDQAYPQLRNIDRDCLPGGRRSNL